MAATTSGNLTTDASTSKNKEDADATSLAPTSDTGKLANATETTEGEKT